MRLVMPSQTPAPGQPMLASAQINLYNPALRLRTDWFAGKALPLWLGAVLLAVAGGRLWLGVEGDQLAQRRDRAVAEMTRLKAELAPLQEGLGSQNEKQLQQALSQAEQRLQQREQLIQALGAQGDGGSGFSAVMRALARHGRPGLWLTGVQVRGPDELRLDGRALDPAQVPSYIKALNSEPELAGRAFAALSLNRPAAEHAPADQAGKPLGAAPFMEFSLSARADEKPRGGEPRPGPAAVLPMPSQPATLQQAAAVAGAALPAEPGAGKP